MIVGVDLTKDAAKLVRAYGDRAGVTAAFNLNLLARMSRALDANFDLKPFKHKAISTTRAARIEMHLVRSNEQSVKIRSRRIPLRAGESQFRDLARSANWHPSRVRMDPCQLFSVHELPSA